MISDQTKISLLLRDFSGGGAERSMINIANGLSARGKDVDLVVFNPEGEFRKYVSETVNIISLDCVSSGLRSWSSIFSLARYFWKRSPDKILTTLEGITLVARFAQKLVRKRPEMVIRIATSFGNEKRPLLREWLIRWCYRSHVGMFVVNSMGSRNELIKSLSLPKDRIEVIYNAVDHKLINSMARQDSEDCEWLAGKQFILNIGRLTTAKRQDLLINAFAMLSRGADLHLIILGEGPLRANLERQIRTMGLHSRVHLPGFATNPYSYLSRASAFVLSSDYEGMPTVLLEALSLGCPVVSTDCPTGPSEILEKGRWGLLTSVGDSWALSDAIRKTLETRTDRERLKIRAADFTIAKMAVAYDKLLQSC